MPPARHIKYLVGPALRALSTHPSVAPAMGLASAIDFAGGLLALEVFQWLAIGRHIIADRTGLAVRQSAWVAVERTLDAERLALTAWEVRDALETAAYLVSRRACRWTPERRRQFAATQGAADAAAMALLARGHLRPEIVRTLCSPFTQPIDFQSR